VGEIGHVNRVAVLSRDKTDVSRGGGTHALTWCTITMELLRWKMILGHIQCNTILALIMHTQSTTKAESEAQAVAGWRRVMGEGTSEIIFLTCLSCSRRGCATYILIEMWFYVPLDTK